MRSSHPITYVSATDLEAALRDAALAHGRHELALGQEDPDWPAWYAQHMWDARADQVAGPSRPV